VPYITLEARDRIAEGGHPRDPGELNYVISKLLIDSARYTYHSGERSKFINREVRNACDVYILRSDRMSYQRINDVVGALICAGHEYARRTGDVFPRTLCADIASDFYTAVAVPYELKKIQENGDLPYATRR
jgi:hypothetical protein